MNAKNFVLALLLTVLIAAQAVIPAYATGTIRHVTPTGLNSGTCGTWATACNLQRALVVVAVSGDQLWVKQGTYKPGTLRNNTFALKNGVSIYGGFVGTETLLSQRNPATHVTILSGNIGSPALATDNSYHVVEDGGANNTAVLDGFTITAGNALGGGTDNNGGGIFIAGSPTLTNLKVIGNSASIEGGGMYNDGNPLLTNVTFSGNTAGYGGGMYNYNGSPTLKNVTFSGDSVASGSGGGMYNLYSNPLLMSVTFNGNSAATGGGMDNYAGNPTLTSVTFSNNSATSNNGGGMYNEITNPKLTNVTLNGNSAAGNGGGMYNYSSSPTLTNVTFSNNTVSSNDGGGMYNDASSNPALTNVNFSGNSTQIYGGGMYNYSSNPTLTNVTFSHNSAGNSGGGMLNWTSAPTLMDVTFDHNSATNFSGGGILNYFSSPTLTNVTFGNNSAGNSGGGILNEDSSSPILTNVTFSGNSAAVNGGGIANTSNSYPSVYDGIFWNDGSEFYIDGTSTPTITDSIIQGGCPSGSTCLDFISSNPLLGPLANNGGFTQTMALAPGSPAIDAGGQHSTCALTDQRGVKRPQGPACDIGAYEAPATKTFQSTGSQDGWILESAKGTGKGGSMNATATTFQLGDDNLNRQYRSILSFNTATLPDTAVIQTAVLKIKPSGSPVGTNPFTVLGTLYTDIRKGYFGLGPALELTDFNFAATATKIGSFGATPVSGWYSATFNAIGKTDINKTSLTQLRLYFATPTNNNNLANYMLFFSGNATTIANQPQLIVTYYVP